MPHLDDFTAHVNAPIGQRFDEVDSEEILISHQSIYAFRQRHAEPFAVYKHVRSNQILKYPSPILFYSLLHVGEAEDHKAGLASTLLGAQFINLAPVCHFSIMASIG